MLASSTLERLAPVGLDELDATAALLTRRDRKYIVPAGVAAQVVERLAPVSRVLEIDGRRWFRYESVYFDTPDRVSYLAAARRRPRRFKVRTRSYLDTGRCLLEIKTRDPRGRTVKRRHEHPIAMRDDLDPSGRAFVGACPLIGERSDAFEPALITDYSRATLLVGAAGVRVTLDRDLRAQAAVGPIASLSGMVIIETKTGGRPSEADRVLWSLGHRPTRVSKFGTSLAVLHPDLPSNRWTRALRQPWVVAESRTGLSDESQDPQRTLEDPIGVPPSTRGLPMSRPTRLAGLATLTLATAAVLTACSGSDGSAATAAATIATSPPTAGAILLATVAHPALRPAD